MKKRAVIVVLIALSLIGTFSFDFVNAEKFISPMISNISPELGSMFNAFSNSISLVKNTDSDLDYMISSSRSSVSDLDTQISMLYDEHPDNKQLMIMKSNLNQVNSILDATEKIQKTYAAIDHIESNIFEIENTVQEVSVSEDTIDAVDESIEEIDNQIEIMIEEDPENEELVNIQSNLEELDELIVESKTVYTSIEESNKKSKELNVLLENISSDEITESEIEELEIAISELDETIPEVDETTPEQIDNLLEEINLDLDTLLENDPNNTQLIQMKSDVYQIDLLTSDFDDLYSAPSDLDTTTLNIEELFSGMSGSE